MPYINVRAADMDVVKEQMTVSTITDLITEVMNKPADAVMVDIEKAEGLYLGGKKLSKGVIVKVEAYGNTPRNKRELINTELGGFFESKLGIPKKNVYVTFTDRSDWGYKGTYLSK